MHLNLCLHSFSEVQIIFTIIILNSFSGRLPISTSFNCFSGVLPCSFIWYIVLCLFILSLFLWTWFSFHRLQDSSSSCFCHLSSGLCWLMFNNLPYGPTWATAAHYMFLLFRPKYSAFIAINLPIVINKAKVFSTTYSPGKLPASMNHLINCNLIRNQKWSQWC